METKSLVLVLFVLGLLFIVACSQTTLEPTQAPSATGACTLACEDESGLQEKIQEYFGYAPNSYTLECSSCNLSRGGFIEAKLERRGELVELYYSWGLCSSGGTDCGWKIKFTVPIGSELYAAQAATYCNFIQAYAYADTLNCTDLEFDTTQQERNNCFLGEYDVVANGKRTLGISQTINRCEAIVEKFI